MTSNSARKKAIRALMAAEGISYAVAARRLDFKDRLLDQMHDVFTQAREAVNAGTIQPLGGCFYIASTSSTDTLHQGSEDAAVEMHWSTREKAQTWLDNWPMNASGTYEVRQGAAPCVTVICSRCDNNVEDENGNAAHHLTWEDADREGRALGWLTGASQHHRFEDGPLCPECLGYPLIHVGQRIRFAGQKQQWKVIRTGAEGRFAICTRGANYTVLDFGLGVRGPVNNQFMYATPRDDAAALTMIYALERGEIMVSERNWVWLDPADDQPDEHSLELVGAIRELAWDRYENFPHRYNSSRVDPPTKPLDDSYVG